jgi:hypothetical protein
MVNHTAKSQKDLLDFISKLVLQTNDPNFANKNILENIELGQIMIYGKDSNPLTVVNNANASYSITALQNYGQQWKNLAQEITSTPDIMGGQNMPSGTAYRQAAIIQQEAHSNFEIMTENKGLHIEKMFELYITPYLLKKMDTTEEISATLGDYGIDKIDKMYIATEAVKRFNRKAVEAVLNKTELPDLAQEQQGVQQELAQAGQRFIKPSDISTKTWKEVIGKFAGSVIYEITGENTEKQAVMDTLSTVLQTISANPQILNDPNGKLLFSKILNETNAVSPLEIQEVQSQPAPVMTGGSAGNNNQIKTQ